MHLLRKLWKDESGATAVEYGLMTAAIAAVIVVIVFTLGGQVQTGVQHRVDPMTTGAGG
jgi:pilus assembly protein Flp/PilA